MNYKIISFFTKVFFAIVSFIYLTISISYSIDKDDKCLITFLIGIVSYGFFTIILLLDLNRKP